VAANIAPTAKQIILLTLILIPFRLAVNVKNEFGDGMVDLCTRDSGIAADLNRQIDKRNHDANRADDLPEVGEVIEIHVTEALPEQI